VYQGDERGVEKYTWCCLGVLFDVIPSSDDDWWEYDPVGRRYIARFTTELGNRASSDTSYGQSVGVPAHQVEHLMRMNDGTIGITKSSFDTIARWIEANVEVRD
jgi:hypothetical protein